MTTYADARRHPQFEALADDADIDSMIDGAAMAIWATTWANAMEERGESVTGEITEQCDDVPNQVREIAKSELSKLACGQVGAYADAGFTSTRTLKELYARAMIADAVTSDAADLDQCAEHDLGFALMMARLGHGVSWEDSHAPIVGFVNIPNDTGTVEAEALAYVADERPLAELRQSCGLLGMAERDPSGVLDALDLTNTLSLSGRSEAKHILARWIGEVDSYGCSANTREAFMAMLDRIIGTHGVEPVRVEGYHVDGYHFDIVATYCNMGGDAYDVTIVHDSETGDFLVTSYADYLEAWYAAHPEYRQA